MFATSNDVLNLVLAICIAALTVFLCLALYYFISSAHRVHKLIGRVENVVEIARDKMKNSATYFMILGEIAKRAMEFVEKKRGGKKK